MFRLGLIPHVLIVEANLYVVLFSIASYCKQVILRRSPFLTFLTKHQNSG